MNGENIKIELYKIYVGTIEKTSARRLQTNSFFIAAIGVILTFFSFLTKGNEITSPQNLSLKLLALFGIVLCVLWFFSTRYYTKLNKAKFKALDELEKDLPYQLFKREWEFFKSEISCKWLTSSRIESVVPLVMVLFFVGVILFLNRL